MEAQLTALQLPYRRVPAWTPDDVAHRFSMINVFSMPGLSSTEMACLASHLDAIHEAVHDPASQHIEYALILEDDVELQMDVDLLSLARSAPPFGILQLFTSNGEEVSRLWSEYKTMSNDTTIEDKMWKEYSWTSGFWSTQAYIIHKPTVRAFIDRVVTRINLEGNNIKHIQLASPSPPSSPNKYSNPFQVGTRSVMVKFKCVADSYLYTAMEPTFVTRIPLFNGHEVGRTSRITSDAGKNARQTTVFQKIGEVLREAKLEGSSMLPSFIRAPQVAVD